MGGAIIIVLGFLNDNIIAYAVTCPNNGRINCQNFSCDGDCGSSIETGICPAEPAYPPPNPPAGCIMDSGTVVDPCDFPGDTTAVRYSYYTAATHKRCEAIENYPSADSCNGTCPQGEVILCYHTSWSNITQCKETTTCDDAGDSCTPDCSCVPEFPLYAPVVFTMFPAIGYYWRRWRGKREMISGQGVGADS